MNTEFLKKVIFIILVGGVLFAVENLFYEASKFTIYHHLSNGLLSVVIFSVVSKTKWGLAFFAKKPDNK